MINNKTLIIILNWNDWKNTIECYQSLKLNNYKNYDVLIIDNGSKPHFFLKLKKFFEKQSGFIFLKKRHKNVFFEKQLNNKIFFLRLNKNYGLTKGINSGFKFAIKNKYKYVMRLDNDTELKPDCLKLLFKTLKKSKVSAVSPKILHWYRKNVVWYKGFQKKWDFLKFQKTMNLKKKVFFDDPKLNQEIEVDGIAGVISLYKVNTLIQVGLGDEDFFYGPEDLELSFRLKKFGKLICNLEACAYHKIARSEKYEKNYKRIFYNIFGFLLLIKKTGNFADKLIGYNFFIIRFICYLIFKKKNKDLITGHQLAIKKFFFGS